MLHSRVSNSWRTVAVLAVAVVVFAVAFTVVRATRGDTQEPPSGAAATFTVPERVATIRNLERVATIKPMRSAAGLPGDSQGAQAGP
jgi:hypothetical protein